MKKGFIGLVIASVIFAVASGVLMYQNFGDRIAQTRTAFEQQWDQMAKEQKDNIAQTKENSDQKSVESKSWDEGYHGHYGRFGDWEYGNRYGYDEENYFAHNWSLYDSKYDMETEWNLTTSDKVMVGVVMGIASVLGIMYWLLCIAWAYQKSHKLGSNSALWVMATLFFNLWAIAGLYIYAGFKGTCKKCGHLKQKGEKYCSHCGFEYVTICENCQSTISSDAAYCPNCGKPVNKEKASNE